MMKVQDAVCSCVHDIIIMDVCFFFRSFVAVRQIFARFKHNFSFFEISLHCVFFQSFSSFRIICARVCASQTVESMNVLFSQKHTQVFRFGGQLFCSKTSKTKEQQ